MATLEKFLNEMHEAQCAADCDAVLVHLIEHLTRSDNKEASYILSLYKTKMDDYRRAAMLEQERRDELGSDS